MLSVEQNAAGTAHVCRFVKRPLSLPDLEIRRGGGGEERGKGLSVWDAEDASGNLGMARPVAVGSQRPDLSQTEQQARIKGPLSPGSPVTPRCSGKNPGGGGCPAPSSQALPHARSPVRVEPPVTSPPSTSRSDEFTFVKQYPGDSSL